MTVDRKDIKVYFGDEKSKSLNIRCFLEIKFADIRLISLEQVTNGFYPHATAAVSGMKYRT